MSIRVFNVSGKVIVGDLKDGSSVSIMPGKSVVLDGHLSIGPRLALLRVKGLVMVRDIPTPTAPAKQEPVRPAQAPEVVEEPPVPPEATPAPPAEAEPTKSEPETEPVPPPEPEKPFFEAVKELDAVLAATNKPVEEPDPAPEPEVEDILVPPADENVPERKPHVVRKPNEIIEDEMRNMLAEDKDLGTDGKPNLPVLRQRVHALDPKIDVTAKTRDRLFAKIKKEEDNE
jgi:hypothetical protein